MWRRILRPRDEAEKKQLLHLLNSVFLSPHEEDALIWTPNKSGLFSVMQHMNSSNPHIIKS